MPINSLIEFMEFLDDMSIDVPDATKMTGIFCGRFIAARLLTFKEFHTILFSPSVPLKSTTVLSTLSTALNEIHNEASIDLKSIWNENAGGLELLDFWPEKERNDKTLAEWMSKNKLFVLNPLMKIVKELEIKLIKEDAKSVIAYLEVLHLHIYSTSTLFSSFFCYFRGLNSLNFLSFSSFS